MTIKMLLGILLLSSLTPAVAQELAAVSRLPRVEDPPKDSDLAKLFQQIREKGGQPLNLQLTIGNAPKINKATLALSYALRFDSITPRKLRELTIIRTAQIAQSDYELAQHYPLAEACGYTMAQLEGLQNWKASSDYQSIEKALLGYIEEVAAGKGVEDKTFETLSGFFNPQEIIEVTVTTGSYYSTALLTKALRVKIEDDGRAPAPGSC